MSRIEPWWTAPEGAPDSDLNKLVGSLLNYDADRRRDIRLGMAMYGDKHAQKSVAYDYALGLSDSALSFNIVKSVCDALQAQIASQHTLSRVMTQRGNWTLQKRAKLAEQLIEGAFEANNVHGQAHMGFLDAAKGGGLTGFKVFSSDGHIKIELVRPGEILVDPVDGKNKDPRAIYQLAFLPRDVVMGLYGDTEELQNQIARAPLATARTAFPWEPQDTQLDTIQVLEAWRKPDPSDWADPSPGRHVIAIDGATLLDEEWARGLPFAFWRYDGESSGFYGRGAAQNLHATQREINYTLQKIQRIMHMNAGFRIILPTGEDGEVAEEEITDSPGQIIRVGSIGDAPQVVVSNAVPPEFRQHLADCIQRGFEQEGVSQLAAQSKKPGGLNSGEAIREYNDIESIRFAIKSKAFERFIGVDLASLVIEEARHLADLGDAKPMRVTSSNRRGVKFTDLRWSDIDLDPSDYQVKVSPASALPRTSAGRQATIEAWAKAGMLSEQQYLMLQRNPDTDAFLSRELAPIELVLDHLEDMIEDGTPVVPEPIQDLELSLRLASNAYQRARADGVPEEHCLLILDYMESLKGYREDAIAAAQAAQAPPTAPVPPGPPGQPLN